MTGVFFKDGHFYEISAVEAIFFYDGHLSRFLMPVSPKKLTTHFLRAKALEKGWEECFFHALIAALTKLV